MIEIGKINNLEVLRVLKSGKVILDGDDLGEIFISDKSCPASVLPGESVKVFLYSDFENEVVATMKEPAGMVGDFISSKVINVKDIGAFLEWGLPKDLFVPLSEQKFPLEKGDSCIAYIYLDEMTDRIAASTKIDKFLLERGKRFSVNSEVSLLIAEKTDLGFKAIINNSHWGIIYHDEIFKPIKIGQKIQGYIKKIRDDGKIDLILEKDGYGRIGGMAGNILSILEKSDGFLPFNDKSSPESIKAKFKMSKKSFKKAIGSLYKMKKIKISPKGITLITK